MSGDLVSLRMMVVSALRPVRDLWRKASGLASVPIEFDEAGAVEARAALAKGGIDILVLDVALPDADREAVLAAARKLKPVPFLAVAGGTARIEGVSLLPKPLSTEDARALVERCIRIRLPTRVLIVDDSSTMRGIVRKILEGSRYTMEISDASEGISALKQLGGGSFDLVLLDQNMPDFTGIETLAEIKRIAPRVAVVLMTSTDDDRVKGRAQTGGALAFLKKPFFTADIDTLLDHYYEQQTRVRS